MSFSESSSSSSSVSVSFPDLPDGLTEEEYQAEWERRDLYYAERRERRNQNERRPIRDQGTDNSEPLMDVNDDGVNLNDTNEQGMEYEGYAQAEDAVLQGLHSHIPHADSQANSQVGGNPRMESTTSGHESSPLENTVSLNQLMHYRIQRFQSRINRGNNYTAGTGSQPTSLDTTDGIANLSVGAQPSAVSSSARNAQVGEINRQLQEATDYPQPQANQATRIRDTSSHPESSTAREGMTHFKSNIPSAISLAYEAQIREYNRLHQAHIERSQTTNEQPASVPAHHAFGGMGNLHGTAAVSSQGASLKAFGDVAQAANHPHAVPTGLQYQAGLGQQRSTTNAAAKSSKDRQEGVLKSPPELLAHSNQTAVNAKSVVCAYCATLQYTELSATKYYCRVCRNLSSS